MSLRRRSAVGSIWWSMPMSVLAPQSTPYGRMCPALRSPMTCSSASAVFWTTPLFYQEVNGFYPAGVGYRFANNFTIDQVFTMEADGRMTVTKGAGTVARTP